MGKMPYIPLYIGDWEQDTNTISIEAEGALIKLTFKLWKSKTKGLALFSFTQLGILFKKDALFARKIMQELALNDVLNIIKIDEDNIQIESRRMTAEVQLSKTRSEAGSTGGRGNKKQNKSKRKAKQKLNPDNEYDNESDNNKDKKESIILKPEIIPFHVFWDMYDKKVGDKEKLSKKWSALTDEERQNAVDHIPKYKTAQPDKQYRKDPGTYLNNKSFNDEIITRANGTQQQQHTGTASERANKLYNDINRAAAALLPPIAGE